MQCPSSKDFYEHVNMRIVRMLSKEEQLASRLQSQCVWKGGSVSPGSEIAVFPLSGSFVHKSISTCFILIVICHCEFWIHLSWLRVWDAWDVHVNVVRKPNRRNLKRPTRFSVLWYSVEFFRLCAWIRCNGILSSEIARQFEELTESQELRQTFIFNEYKCTFLH